MGLKLIFIVPVADRDDFGNPKMSPFILPQINSLSPFLSSYEVIYLEAGFSAKVVLEKISQLKQLKRRISQSREEVIIYSLYGSLHGFLVRLVLGKKFRIVNTFGGSDVFGSTNGGVMWLFRNFITISLSLWTLRRVSHVIVKSQNLYERIADRTGAAISIIANGVDVSVFDINKNRDEYRVEKGWAEDDFVILFNLRRGDSKLEKVKNYPLAKEVFEVLQSRVQKKIHLELISGKTHLEMNQLFNAADCLLLTSLHEGSPNIVKEAMACNLPIVSVNCGDVKERLSSVNNSFVSKDYCPKELASYCEKLVAGKLRSNGREILINQGLDSESVAKNLLTIFKSIN